MIMEAPDKLKRNVFYCKKNLDVSFFWKAFLAKSKSKFRSNKAF